MSQTDPTIMFLDMRVFMISFNQLDNKSYMLTKFFYFFFAIDGHKCGSNMCDTIFTENQLLINH